jgi:hypothetical protein
MVVLGLTGHGLSRAVIKNLPADYIYMVRAGLMVNGIPDEYFSGIEFADQIASLEADEVIVFVQSCNSGVLSRVNFMNKYAQILANEVSQKRKNIAVITPVNEYLLSPINGFEPILQRTFEKTQDITADVVTYAQFKDALVRTSCEDKHYYPQSEIKNPAAVQASAELNELGTLEGIDPQFYESIDPSLPVFLTHQGIPKFRSGTLALPPKGQPSNDIQVSPETQAYCAKRQAESKSVFDSREQERLYFLNEINSCSKSASRSTCIQQIRERLNPTR